METLRKYIDKYGHERYRYGPQPVELPNDPEWEMFQEMCAQAEEANENADHELSTKRPTSRHCPVPMYGPDEYEPE
jgi:hypothetical protein